MQWSCHFSTIFQWMSVQLERSHSVFHLAVPGKCNKDPRTPLWWGCLGGGGEECLWHREETFLLECFLWKGHWECHWQVKCSKISKKDKGFCAFNHVDSFLKQVWGIFLLLYYLKIRIIEGGGRNRGRSFIYWFIYQVADSSQSLVVLKLGTICCFWVSQRPWTSLCCFGRPLAGSWIIGGAARAQTSTHMLLQHAVDQ